MGPTGQDFRVMQIHPTLRCNLRCLHCYSLSSPAEEGELSLALLRDTITDAQAERYNVLGVSGGEPLMFSALRTILQHARSCGMLTTVTTNGILLSPRRLEELQGVVDLLAISVDGVAASHNRVRGTPQAFETMSRRLKNVRKSGVPFGFIFTLTLYNLHELEAVARFAVEQGAALLQVHPLEEVGRAQSDLPGSAPDELELAYAYVEVARVQQLFQGQLQVQFDIVDREFIRLHPERVFADGATTREDVTGCPLAELVSPLVVEDNGFVVPMQYGFSHAYAIGNLKEGSLRQHALRWKKCHYHSFVHLCRMVFHELVGRAELPFANWYQMIRQFSSIEAPVSNAEACEHQAQ
jgi:MoaA/NifB/PqqE/SkfB family radical SAM enzyme